MADRTVIGEYLSGLVHMLVIMAPEAAGPVAVPDVFRIRPPVHFHGGKDRTAVDVLRGRRGGFDVTGP